MSASAIVGGDPKTYTTTKKDTPPAETKDTVGNKVPVEKSATDKGVEATNTKAMSFVTQAQKQAVVKMESEKDKAKKEDKEVKKLDKKELGALEKITNTAIKTDAALEAAVDKVTDNLNKILGIKSPTLKKVEADQVVVEEARKAQEELSKEDEEKLKEVMEEVDKNYSDIEGLKDEIEEDPELDHPEITDENNEPIEGMGSANSKLATAMFNLGSTLCPEIKPPNMKNFKSSMNIFKGLLSLAAKLGLNKLLKKLIECVKFYEKLKENPLKKAIKDVSKRGDDKTFSTITSVIGPDVKDKKKVIKNLIRAIDKEDTTEVEKGMEDLHIDKKELLEKNPNDTNMYKMSSQSIPKYKKLQGKKNKGFLNNFIGHEKNKLYHAVAKHMT